MQVQLEAQLLIAQAWQGTRAGIDRALQLCKLNPVAPWLHVADLRSPQSNHGTLKVNSIAKDSPIFYTAHVPWLS